MQYDEPPCILMKQCKQKGKEAFLNGKRNEANNVQYYRDSVNHYYEAFAWCERIDPVETEENHEVSCNNKEKNDQVETETYTEQELNEIKSTLCSNAAMAHMMLKNWG